MLTIRIRKEVQHFLFTGTLFLATKSCRCFSANSCNESHSSCFSYHHNVASKNSYSSLCNEQFYHLHHHSHFHFPFLRIFITPNTVFSLVRSWHVRSPSSLSSNYSWMLFILHSKPQEIFVIISASPFLPSMISWTADFLYVRHALIPICAHETVI